MGAQMMLSQRQKAAVIVRLLLDEDDSVDLSVLDGRAQGLLAEEMAGMDMIDRSTRDAIIDEFCDSLESVGVTFPGGLDPTLDILGPRISGDTTDRLRRVAAMSGGGNPWPRLGALPTDQLIRLAEGEAVEMVALLLSKLPVVKASDVFSALGPERARAVAHAISMTGGVTPSALQRVGMVLLRAADALPRPAIDSPAVDRVGAILNFATADIRDSVLEGLEQDDADFAGGVRKAIFTFAHIPARIDPRDVPKIVREVDAAMLTRALAGAQGDDAATAEFILSNMSQRMADGIREEVEALGKVRARDAEEAMKEVITAIRASESQGDLVLAIPEEDDEE